MPTKILRFNRTSISKIRVVQALNLTTSPFITTISYRQCSCSKTNNNILSSLKVVSCRTKSRQVLNNNKMSILIRNKP